MWRVEEIVAENFLGYEKMQVKLSGKGVTLVLGDRGAGRSNGSGKSTFMHAIPFAMWGKLPRKLENINKVIRRGATACSVAVRVTDGKGSCWITRGRNARGSDLKVEGFDTRATIDGEQAAIDARYGSYDLFMSTALFSGDVSSFCRLTDGPRKELLERMVGVSHFSAAATEAKNRETAVSTEIQMWESQLASAMLTLERRRDEKTRVAVLSLKHAGIVKRAYRKLVVAAQAHNDASGAAHDALAEWLEGARTKRAASEKAQEAAERRIADIEDEIAKLDKEASNARVAVDTSRNQIVEIEQAIADLSEGTHPDTCPTCGQRWEQDTAPSKLRSMLTEKREAIAAIKQRVAPHQAQVIDLGEKRQDLQEALREAKIARRQAEALVDDREYRRLVVAAAEADAEETSAQRDAQAYAESHDVEPDSDEMASVDAALKDAQDAVDDLEENIAQARRKRDAYAFWKKGFGRGGLPSFLIDSSIPGMSTVAAEIASDLTDGELTVRFNPAAVKGSSTVFAVEVDYADGGEGFDSVSHGEQTRVDVAVLFAIRDLAAQRGGIECEQLFLDEVMDGADEHFVESFFRMIRRRFSGRQVYVISHEPSAVSLVDRTMTARKVGKISTIS